MTTPSTRGGEGRAAGGSSSSRSRTRAEDVLVPDLAGWRRERMPEMPDVVGFTLAPDWVCEVLSPSTPVPLELGLLWRR